MGSPPSLVVHYGHTGLDPGSVHIVYPAGSTAADTSDPDNLEDVTRARNLPLIDIVRRHSQEVAAAKNLSADHARALHGQLMSGFVGSRSDLEDFASRPRLALSTLDKSGGFPLREVYGWAEGAFHPGFFQRMMSTMLIGYPIMGPGELFLCAMTDYRRPSEPKGDLVGDRGYAEVKAEGRLGGQRPDRDGQQSKSLAATVLGFAEDPSKSWCAASYRWLSEALSMTKLTRAKARAVASAMMNYECEVDPGMVPAMLADPQAFHAALHLHCYSVRRGFGEVLFLSRDRTTLTSYAGSTFAEARSFADANLRNRGGWGGWSQDRSGVQVEHVRST